MLKEITGALEWQRASMIASFHRMWLSRPLNLSCEVENDTILTKF